MGDRRRKRDEFFRAHPRCCFCAGEALAIEQDHQPGRVFFSERRWPEGFVFPACTNCNAHSRAAEAAVATLVFRSRTARDRSDQATRLASLRSNRPDMGFMVPISTRDKRRVAGRFGVVAPAGQALSSIPMVRINRDKWMPEVELIAHKLMLALHYQQFGVPLSRAGGVFLRAATNLEIQSGEMHRQLLGIAGRENRPMRGRQYLDDQFSIRWDRLAEPRCAVFVAQLQDTFCLYGITTEDPASVRVDEHDEPLRPLSWD